MRIYSPEFGDNLITLDSGPSNLLLYSHFHIYGIAFYCSFNVFCIIKIYEAQIMILIIRLILPLKVLKIK